MAKQKLKIRNFSGGLATTSEKIDIPNSARFLKNMNHYEDPAYIINSRVPSKVSGAIVTGLPLWMEDGSPYDTNRYILDNGGVVYEVDSSDNFSSIISSTGAGEGLKVFDDYLYIATSTSIGRYGPLSGTPSHTTGYLGTGTLTIDQTGGGTGAADYVPPIAISEAADQRQTFTPDNDPLRLIKINIDVVGTGDWTVTVHDEDNNEICSDTIANGDLAAGNQIFTMDTRGRMVIGNEYHFHVTSTVADGGVDTETATDLEGAYFVTYFAALIDTDFHPMVVLEDTLIIGNERYIATWNQVEYEPNQIVLDPGFQVRAIAKFEEFVVIGAIKGSTVSDSEEARLYFWDGIIASTVVSYNYYIDVSVGTVNALHNSKGRLLGVYGNRGSIYLGTDQLENIIHEAPKLTRGKKVEVYPGGITEYDGRTLIGYAGSTDDGTGLEQGVYEFGKQQAYLPDSFGFPYTISTGTTQATTVQIGMVKAFGTDLYIGWRDDSTYGVDKVSFSSNGYASGSWESLIFDAGETDDDLLPEILTITFEPLTTGQSVTPKYKLDRASSWTTGTAASTVGDTKIELPIYTRCAEIEFGFNIASTSNTHIKITGVILEYDDLAEEDL